MLHSMQLKKSINTQAAGKIIVCDDEKFNCDIIYSFLMILGVTNRKDICEFAYNGEQCF